MSGIDILKINVTVIDDLECVCEINDRFVICKENVEEFKDEINAVVEKYRI